MMMIMMSPSTMSISFIVVVSCIVPAKAATFEIYGIYICFANRNANGS